MIKVTYCIGSKAWTRGMTLDYWPKGSSYSKLPLLYKSLNTHLNCRAFKLYTVQMRVIWSGFERGKLGVSLVAQWLRIRLPMQRTQVRALVWKAPTCCGATKPAYPNY